jgi:hypothetical protein
LHPVKSEVVMGQQRRIKQLRRELKHIRRKNQQEELLYFVDKYDVFPAEEPMLEDQNAEVDQINEDDKEIGEILKILMPVCHPSEVKILSFGHLKWKDYLVQ